jgi:hypothetical protein
MNKILCFIKFSTDEFAGKLFRQGQIYFNLPSTYSNSLETERGDINEGAEWIDNSEIVNIKAEHPTLGMFEFKPLSNPPSTILQYNYYYLSFSLYAITPELFENSNTYKIDSRMSEFGDTAVIIEEPYIFLNSVIEELKKKNMKYEIKQVIYRDLTNKRTDLTPFDKKQEHQHHCEFRIIIKNVDNEPKTIEIGSIEKFSRLISSDTIVESIWTATKR